ncbi:MAG: hypothetical protein BKP49_08520 [Treponema sp. CETP13]|nr:MAG: hypothetical protein BKP49_08520 [Treponema sp. CETP13]
MEKTSPVEIFKAQYSNKAAEKCFGISNFSFVILLIVSIMLLSFSFVMSRVQQGLILSSPNLYPGFGGVLQDMAKQTGDFSVDDGELNVSFNYPRRLESNGWLVVVTDDAPALVLDEEKTGAYQPMFILGESSFVISQPATNTSLEGAYRFLGFFSSTEIRKIVNNVNDMVTYTKAFLFASATGEIPSSIISMILLMGVQYVFFIFISGLLLTTSHRSAIKGTEFWQKTKLLPSIKIMTVLGFAPSFLLALVSHFNPTMGVTFGWLLFSIITSVRAVYLYVKRMKAKPIIWST